MTMVASYRFGPFTVDAGSYRLLRGSDVIPLSPKIIDLLLYLVARQSTLVAKDELFAALWPDVAVTDNALTQAVSELRQALGDDPSNPTYIQTVARRGYRFIAPVESASPPAASPQSGVARRRARPRLRPSRCSILRMSAPTASSRGSRRASRKPSPTICARRHAPHHRSRPRRRGGPPARRRSRARCARSCISISRSSAASSAPAIGFGSRRASWTPPPAKRSPRRRRTARSSRSSSSRIASSRSSPRRLGSAALGSATARRTASRDEQPRGLPGVHGRTGAARVARRVARAWRDCRFRTRDRARSALRARARRPRQCAILAVRDVAGAQSAGGGAAGARHRSRSARDRARAESCRSARDVLVPAGQRRPFQRSAGGGAPRRRAGARYWGNQFRLAHAEWGEDRLRTLARAMELYPDFPFAHFEAAMVHIARGSLERAESVLREGTIVQDRQAQPASSDIRRKGCTGCSGSCVWRAGDAREARAEFEREIAVGSTQLYAAEFAMNAYDGAGFRRASRTATPAKRCRCSRARSSCSRSTRDRSSARRALADGGDDGAADRSVHACRQRDRRAAARRPHRRSHPRGSLHARRPGPRTTRRLALLKRLVDRPELPFTGWTIPIEPLSRSAPPTR